MLSLSLVPLSLALLVAARLHHSRVPEDPYAFPKYRVSFLHGLPLLNETAERWLRDGLRGGEPEFLDQPWQESQWDPTPLKSIEASDDPSSDADLPHQSNYTLQHMKLGPKASYLCLIPPTPQDPPPVEDTPSDVTTPVHSWSLLQPLSGKCLYHRQGWFTYSYCHNSHVRQFHELHHQHIPSTGEYKPEEDPEWEAYTLGRAPPTLEAGAELTTAEAAAAANLELARGAGSRYLVQRWGDGTYCDKTGRKRDVEIQFHCSMTMTDTVLFVKETQTCHYVVHIATPRLCGEPGFRSRIDAEEEHFIRCRAVLAQDAFDRADRSLPASSQPFPGPPPPHKRVIAAPPPPPPEPEPPRAGQGHSAGQSRSPGADTHEELIRRAVQRLLARQGARGGGADMHVVLEQLPDGEGEVLVEFVDVDLFDGDGEFGDGLGPDGGAPEYADGEEYLEEIDDEARLYDVLRAAGYTLKGKPAAGRGRGREGDGAEDGGAEEDGGDAERKHRDEL
ncbi:glucosidase II beta subunit-like protein-domain-containing protein [Trametes elegans]|nr:glucosidase II beta subunit-like protein-domain-containing protein [Trametes elegans]